MSSSKFNGLSSNPTIVEVRSQKFFLCQETGELCTVRVGIPGRNNSLNGTFSSWNAVISYLNRVYNSEALQNQKNTVMASITQRAFANADAQKIIPLDDAVKKLRVFPGSEGLDWSEFIGDIPLITSGGQTIQQALDKIEKKKQLRKERELKSHKMGYGYRVSSDDDMTFKLQKDASVADLLADLEAQGVDLHNVLHYAGDDEEAEDYSDYLIYYNRDATGDVNVIASAAATLFNGVDTKIRGDALIVTLKRPVCHAFLKAIGLEDDEDEEETSGDVKLSKKRKQLKGKRASKKAKEASEMED